jgi:hypothetical protein
MSQRLFFLTAALIFSVIALGHLLRLALGGGFVVQGFSVPMWASGVAVVVMAYLAWQGFRLAGKTPTRV